MVSPPDFPSYRFDAKVRFLFHRSEETIRPIVRRLASRVIDACTRIRKFVYDRPEGREPGAISGAFYSLFAAMIEILCRQLRDPSGINRTRLTSRAFRIFPHSRVPPNHGSLPLGPAMLAAIRTEEKG